MIIVLNTAPSAVEESANLFSCIADVLPQLVLQLSKEGLSLDEIKVSDKIHSWEPQSLEKVRQVVVHALTNAIDHGYIRPTRNGIKTSDPVRIELDATFKGEDIEIEIKDYGMGLDLEKLAELAKNSNFTPKPHETIADVVFIEGLSTAQNITESSGRGVGMPAIKDAASTLNGNVKISNWDKGARLLVRFPAKHFRRPKRHEAA